MMSVAQHTNRFFASVLAAAILTGLIFAWWPRYWAVAIAVCTLSLVGIAWAPAMRETFFDWRFIAVALIGVWAPAQLFFGSTVLPALTAREAVYWGTCSLAFILASQILSSRTAGDWFLKLILAASVVLAVVAIIQKYVFPLRVFGVFPAPAATFGTFYYENQFAAFMEIAAPIALWRILRGQAVLGGVCYAILFGATIVSASRAGVLLVLLELAVFLIVALFSGRMALPTAGMILALLAAAAVVVGTNAIQAKFEGHASEEVRLGLAKSTLQMIRQRPWSGFGMGTWRPVYPRFATFDIALTANEAHDDWLQWTAEGGIPFSLLIAVLAVSLAMPAARSIWGLGFLVVLAHSFVDYVLREPALAFLWFAVGGALCQFKRLESRLTQVSGNKFSRGDTKPQ